jgi:hypothetical protein
LPARDNPFRLGAHGITWAGMGVKGFDGVFDDRVVSKVFYINGLNFWG